MDFFNFFLNNLLKTFLRKLPKYIIFLLIFITITFISSSCFAVGYSLTYEYNDTTYYCYTYDERKGYVLVVDNNGVPYRCLYVAQRDNADTFVYDSSLHTIHSLSQENTTHERRYIFNNNTGYYQDTYQGSYTGPFYCGDDYFIMYSNRDIYNTDGTLYLAAETFNEPSSFIDPYIVNTGDISTWSFSNLYISLGSETFSWLEDGIAYEPTWWTLNTTYMGHTYFLNLSDYKYTSSSVNEDIFKIPRNYISNSFNLYDGEDIIFSITKWCHPLNISTTYYLDSFTLDITTEQQEQINSDSDKQVLGSIDNNISNINNGINNISEEITSSDIDNNLANDFADLSDNFSVVDPTSLNDVFDILYGAFCEDEVVSLTFTLPFVNKQITISSDNISSYYPTALKSFISVCSWGVIGLFVLKDIRNIINKIAEGSPEDVGSDVKKEVL